MPQPLDPASLIPPIFKLAQKDPLRAMDQTLRLQEAWWRTTTESANFALRLQQQATAQLFGAWREGLERAGQLQSPICRAPEADLQEGE